MRLGLKLIVPHSVLSVLSLIMTVSIGISVGPSDFFSDLGISSCSALSEVSTPSRPISETRGLPESTLGREISTPIFLIKSSLSPERDISTFEAVKPVTGFPCSGDIVTFRFSCFSAASSTLPCTNSPRKFVFDKTKPPPAIRTIKIATPIIHFLAADLLFSISLSKTNTTL